jgi:hypothetical protein
VSEETWLQVKRPNVEVKEAYNYSHTGGDGCAGFHRVYGARIAKGEKCRVLWDGATATAFVVEVDGI